MSLSPEEFAASLVDLANSLPLGTRADRLKFVREIMENPDKYAGGSAPHAPYENDGEKSQEITPDEKTPEL